MTITANSRYAEALVVFVHTEKGVNQTIYTPPINTKRSYRLYMSKEGDTFDLLAWRLYSDSRLYWRIADMNPHIFYPGEIPPGSILRIPYG